MPSKEFALTLAKLLIAAAWADGELDNSELNALKDLLFSFHDLTDREWTIINMYIDSPVSSEEANRLLKNVLESITTEEEKSFVLSWLTRLFEADGVITDDEKNMLDDIKTSVESKRTGTFSQLTGILSKALTKRSDNYRKCSMREERIDDYLRNTIYFQLGSLLETEDIYLTIPDDQLRKLCLAAGLMARVAWVDETLSEEEKQVIQKILTEVWGLPENETTLITAMSCSKVMHGLDYYRLTRSFFECTLPEERSNFLKCLFLVANSSEKTSNKEIEEIRLIAHHLLLDHRDFIDAKLSISDENRHSL